MKEIKLAQTYKFRKLKVKGIFEADEEYGMYKFLSQKLNLKRKVL
jgi:hypothetical protein